MNFRYFCGPLQEMADLSPDEATCSLCGQPGRCFRLGHAICDSLTKSAKETGFGCVACLQRGRFAFSHDTEIGLLDRNGLTHFYNHHRNPPPDFSVSAIGELLRTPQIVTWQQEVWLTHCDDFMAYLGTWEPKDFRQNAPGGDGRALFLEMTDKDLCHLWDESMPPGAEQLEGWYATYYAFRCLHCGRLRGNWDCA